MILTDTDIEQEIEFPEPDADDVQDYRRMNGWNVYFLDGAGEPQVIFIGYRSWSQALENFERRIDHTIIIRHTAAHQDYDFA